MPEPCPGYTRLISGLAPQRSSGGKFVVLPLPICGSRPAARRFSTYYCAYGLPGVQIRRDRIFRGSPLEHHKLDSIDMRILAELQADGRITNVELSRRAKITADRCQEVLQDGDRRAALAAEATMVEVRQAMNLS